ncbi:tRNA (adenine(58)-N(1))-methyltransferase non-catalytic subunit TRM6-like [Schistocerca gregaria]|uniref:tRNA (adenine(58)-N(1))-methyltransferase non-catalytic subunit TRM6-like n=1 Tax=Schistocerca gregaria TaxID=7010 RepID=UPI00211DDDB6|nr:tRNA (adenine(58)-N(1))-methyltransferase non-catalytic subunit TRM6-like [Schistocerca gregaria]
MSALEVLKTDELRGTSRPSGQDNKDLCDRNDAQKLSEVEILELKQSGKSGELIKALINNSATFNQRTEFSQAKYLRKKSEKHQVIVQLLRPTSFLICRTYFNKKPQKILNIREDTLAHIMQLGNLNSGIRVTLIDGCAGLILGSIVSRLGGHGRVFHLYRGETSHPDILLRWNFPPAHLSVVKAIPLPYFLGQLMEEEYLEKGTRSLADACVHETHPRRKKPQESSEIPSNTAEGSAGITEQANMMKKERRKALWTEFVESTEELKTKKTDSLIIVGPTCPESAIELLWDTLNVGGYFVIYSEYIQALIECYLKLHQNGDVVNLKLSETLYRHYQVLPRSTHPKNHASATGGYLLSGIKVQQPETKKL